MKKGEWLIKPTTYECMRPNDNSGQTPEEHTPTSSHLLMIFQNLDIFLMKYESETFDKFEYQRMVQKQTNKSIKALWSDRGEYLTSEFLDHLKENEIFSE